jgi:hypothetical protein
VYGVNSLWYRDLKQLNKVDSLAVPIKGALKRYFNAMALPLYVDNILPHFNLNNIHIFSFIIFNLLKLSVHFEGSS